MKQPKQKDSSIQDFHIFNWQNYSKIPWWIMAYGPSQRACHAVMHQHTLVIVEPYMLELHDFLGSQMGTQAPSRHQGQNTGFILSR